jgi:hypothetical protein
MTNKSNAVNLEWLKLSLDNKQKAPLMALGEENVRRVLRKTFRKAVGGGFRAREDKEKDETYEKAVAQVLREELPGLVSKMVAMTEATSVQFQQLKKSWLVRFRGSLGDVEGEDEWEISAIVDEAIDSGETFFLVR